MFRHFVTVSVIGVVAKTALGIDGLHNISLSVRKRVAACIGPPAERCAAVCLFVLLHFFACTVFFSTFVLITNDDRKAKINNTIIL